MLRERVTFFWALFANWALVIPIRLQDVAIPQYAIKESNLVLGCDFDLESDQLLSLKWYKDGHEFFRYYMHPGARMQTFSVEGVLVDSVQSSLNSVVLKNVTLKTSGAYKCEVSADRTFRTLSKQGDIIVIAPPKGDPEIKCSGEHASLGETVSCNCTSFRSKPAASLMFYINDEKADFGDLIEYLPMAEQDGLETSVLGLRFQAQPKHFRGILELKCTATIGNLYRFNKKIVGQEGQDANAQPSSPGHNRLLAGATYTGAEVGKWVHFFLLFTSSLILTKIGRNLAQCE